MIPPRMLRGLAENLSGRTRSGTVHWHRDPGRVQRYIYRLNPGEIVVRYDPSSGASDTIELAVIDAAGQVIGSLVGVEDEPRYDTLADLLFEIQRATDQGSHRQVTDQILDILKS